MEFFLMRKAIEELPDNDVPDDGGGDSGIPIRGEVPVVGLPIDDIDVIIAGSRINF
jgi:hypothetical protein